MGTSFEHERSKEANCSGKGVGEEQERFGKGREINAYFAGGFAEQK